MAEWVKVADITSVQAPRSKMGRSFVVLFLFVFIKDGFVTSKELSSGVNGTFAYFYNWHAYIILTSYCSVK